MCAGTIVVYCSRKKRGISSKMPRVRPSTWMFSVMSAPLLGRRGIAARTRGRGHWGADVQWRSEWMTCRCRGGGERVARVSCSCWWSELHMLEMSAIGLAVLADWSALRAPPDSYNGTALARVARLAGPPIVASHWDRGRMGRCRVALRQCSPQHPTPVR